MSDLNRVTKSPKTFSEMIAWIIVAISFCFMISIFTFTHWLLKSKNGEIAYQVSQIYRSANNTKQAIIWLKRAVDEGNARAANNLGVLYNRGGNLEKNREKAMALYKIAADRGNDNGMYNLGLNYSHLNKKDHNLSQSELEQAIFWYKKAVERGNYCAANDLGILYATGQGVSQDTSKSNDHFYKSGQNFLIHLYKIKKIKSNDLVGKLYLLKWYAEYQSSQAKNNDNSTAFHNISAESMLTIKDLASQIVKECWQ